MFVDDSPIHQWSPPHPKNPQHIRAIDQPNKVELYPPQFPLLPGGKSPQPCPQVKRNANNLYLSKPPTWGRHTNYWLNEIVNKITAKIGSWQPSSISQVGRNYLIKSVTNVMRNHITNVCNIPSSTCHRINKLQAKIRRGKRSYKFCKWLRWKEICKPTAIGGIRIRTITTMNQALFLRGYT